MNKHRALRYGVKRTDWYTRKKYNFSILTPKRIFPWTAEFATAVVTIPSWLGTGPVKMDESM